MEVVLLGLVGLSPTSPSNTTSISFLWVRRECAGAAPPRLHTPSFWQNDDIVY